jgi:outer membrane immunogenic protein
MSKRISFLAVALAAMAAVGASEAKADAFNGPYIGGHTGYGFGDVDQPYGGVGGPFVSNQDSPEIDGWIYGIQGGYNFRAGNWAFGGEAQATWGDREGDDGGSGGDVNGVEVNYEWSLRGRAGYVFGDRFWLYGTAGYVSMDADATAPGESDNESIEGWTYGVGGELAISDRFSVTAEVRADEMDETRFSFPGNGYDEGLTPNTTSVRVGFNWHPF